MSVIRLPSCHDRHPRRAAPSRELPVLTWTQVLAICGLVITECTVLWMEPVIPVAICGPNCWSSELAPGQPVAVELGSGLIDGPGYVEVTDYLVRDLVGQYVLDRWVVDQRLHGRRPPAPAQTPITATGARTQPRTMSTTETGSAS
jgi:hypothetical protein